MSKYVAIELYSKQGSYFVENCEEATSSIEIFCLKNGAWTQEYVPPLVDDDVGNLRLAPKALMPVSRHRYLNAKRLYAPLAQPPCYNSKYDSQQRAQAIAIKHMDNDNRQLLLTRLNEVSRLQQIHDKVIEIEEGDVLVNAVGEIIKSFHI
jgi:hypothetical protein